MLLIENEKYFDDTIAFAKQIGFYEPTSETGNGNHYLKNRLDYLRRVAQASRPWRARERRETGERGMAGPDSAVAGRRAGAWRAPDRGRPRRDVSRIG